jgi:hypothetical protein
MDQRPSATSQCARCIFKINGRAACVAFPRGIPADILTGRFDHTVSHVGDGGIRFVPLRRDRPVSQFSALS